MEKDMLSFKDFLSSSSHEDLLVIKEAVSQNTKGVMHELLVGFHLNGGKHMSKHASIDGLGPEEAHDKLKSQMDSSEYSRAYHRAKAAADHIKGQLQGGKVHSVHWTSKPGDLKRSTGIEASQKEDASDVVVTTKDPSHPTGYRHHGVSLKVTDGKSEIPVSNPGLESTYGGKEILDNHRNDILKTHSKLSKLTNKDERKEFVRNNPKVAADIKKRNTATLSRITDNMHSKLTAMKPKDLVNHLRDHVLHAHQTPMQKLGHAHIRHTAYGDDTHSAINPAEYHEHILKSPQHISVEKKGTSVIFSHKGVPFARHRMKFESQSDPMSSVKGSGELIKYKKAKV
jgi:hypothetical protein